jgi:protein SCO1/2
MIVRRQGFLLLGLLWAVWAAPLCAELWHVVESDPDKRIWVIRPAADEQATTIQVRVGPGDAAIDYTGRTIQGKLVEGQTLFMERIWPADPMQVRLVDNANRALRRDTVTRGRQVYRSLGEYLPPFALYNQKGDLVRPESWRGRYVVLNFIFTRCQLPEMCPAATMRMAELQQAAKDAGLENVQLASITFDAEYDTPGILNFYASTRGIDFGNFDFLTGSPEAINDLMRQFGIITVNEDDTINHTMGTLLISPNGQIIYRREGSRWSALDFIQRIQTHQAR